MSKVVYREKIAITVKPLKLVAYPSTFELSNRHIKILLSVQELVFCI